MTIAYELPSAWGIYDPTVTAPSLAEAKGATLALRTMPYQRAWVEKLQQIELKMEIAGTSRIEGADFTDRELDAVLKEGPEQMRTRSQRQARAALETYGWIAGIPADRPITPDLVCEIHRRIVTGADDDHCPPGQLRTSDHNVTFGTPRHRGADGGAECIGALERLCSATQSELRGLDPLLQAMAVHYHLAAMHPFLDGNGRTARAVEALLLQRAGLRDSCFIAMSNYYYDEKAGYLKALADVRAANHNLTPFFVFALKGVQIQVHRLLTEIQREMKKALFRNTMVELFDRMQSDRKRVIAGRQMNLLTHMLDQGEPIPFPQLAKRTKPLYDKLRKPQHALIRDLTNLLGLRAIEFVQTGAGPRGLAVRLEWPTEITETGFVERLKLLPRAKTHPFLRGSLEPPPATTERGTSGAG